MNKENLPDPIPKAVDNHLNEAIRLRRALVPKRIFQPGMTLQEQQLYGASIAEGIGQQNIKQAREHEQAIIRIYQEFPEEKTTS